MKTYFRIGDLVIMKGMPTPACSIEDVHMYEKQTFYNIRHFGRPTFLASDGPFLFDELEAIFLNQQEVDNIMDKEIKSYLKIWKGYDIKLNTFFPKPNKKSNKKLLKKRLGLK